MSDLTSWSRTWRTIYTSPPTLFTFTIFATEHCHLFRPPPLSFLPPSPLLWRRLKEVTPTKRSGYYPRDGPGFSFEVACRDYPQPPRHLCLNFPFGSTPNATHCHLNKLEELCYIQHYSVVFFHFSLSVGNGKNANQTVFLSCTRCTSSWKVICGRDKGKIGEINKIFTHNSTIVIKDVSVKTTHMKSLDKFLSSNVM
ncbi:BnaC03g14780D, partial [Brassica napus]